MKPRANRISKLYNTKLGVLHSARSIFKDSPLTFISAIFLIILLIFTFSFRISQSSIYSQSSSGSIYSNMFWMTVMTMTTVGYGQYSPRTQIGRLLGALCVTCGSLIVSVMVVVLTSTFAMNKSNILIIKMNLKA